MIGNYTRRCTCGLLFYRSVLNVIYTGTLETAGLTPIQTLEIVRGCKGLNLVGADVVEVCNYFCMCSVKSFSVNCCSMMHWY